jgi:3-oxoacyl-[acyl-carrier protein] reductase
MLNVVVTGGSRGLGLGIAHKLALAGYNVIAIARRESEQLVGVMRDLESGTRGTVHFRSFDLAAVAEIPLLVTRLREEFGPIYGLVNNAALGASGMLATMRNAEIERMVQLNTVSPLVLTKYVVRSMMAVTGESGRIVNIASIVGLTGFSGAAVYGATKAALLGFTRSLARELGPLGINVNAIAPGFLDTEMTQGFTEEQREQTMRRSALRRTPDVDDIANAVDFLLGDSARNITGIVLTVDAGRVA